MPPTLGESIPGGERTIAIHVIVQDILRACVAADEDMLPRWLDSLAFHVEAWLRAAVGLGEFERAHVMSSHAETLLAHIEQMQFTSSRVAQLYGNLAGFYVPLGDDRRAEELLLRELSHLERHDPVNTILVIQARLALASLYLHRHRSTSPHAELRTTLRDAVRHLEYVLEQARGVVSEYPDAALKLAVDARIALNNPEMTADDALTFRMLAAAFDDLESRIPVSAYAANMALLDRAEQLLQDEQFHEAELCCRTLLERGISGPLDPEARRRLVESLARQGKWREARDEVREWRENPTAPRLYRNTVCDLIHNVGLMCIIAQIQGDSGSLDLLDDLLAWSDADGIRVASAPARRARIGLLTVFHHHRREQPVPEAEIEHLRHEDLNEGDQSDPPWNLMRLFLLGLSASPFQFA